MRADSWQVLLPVGVFPHDIFRNAAQTIPFEKLAPLYTFLACLFDSLLQPGVLFVSLVRSFIGIITLCYMIYHSHDIFCCLVIKDSRGFCTIGKRTSSKEFSRGAKEALYKLTATSLMTPSRKFYVLVDFRLNSTGR